MSQRASINTRFLLLAALGALAIGAVGGVVVHSVTSDPPGSGRQACRVIVKRCGDTLAKDCAERMEKMRMQQGRDYAETLACLDQAKSCMSVAGCLAGADLAGMERFVNQKQPQDRPALEEKSRQALKAFLEDLAKR